MNNRNPRDSKVPASDLLTPIDALKFGSDEDPCFGKLYDLNEDDCLLCGDHEICAIVFSNRGHQKRIAWEKKNPAMDMRLDKAEIGFDIKQWIKEKQEKKIPPTRLRIKLKARFNLRDEAVTKYL